MASASALALLDVSLLASAFKEAATVLNSSVRLKLEQMPLTPLSITNDMASCNTTVLVMSNQTVAIVDLWAATLGGSLDDC